MYLIIFYINKSFTNWANQSGMSLFNKVLKMKMEQKKQKKRRNDRSSWTSSHKNRVRSNALWCLTAEHRPRYESVLRFFEARRDEKRSRLSSSSFLKDLQTTVSGVMRAETYGKPQQKAVRKFPNKWRSCHLCYLSFFFFKEVHDFHARFVWVLNSLITPPH